MKSINDLKVNEWATEAIDVEKVGMGDLQYPRRIREAKRHLL